MDELNKNLYYKQTERKNEDKINCNRRREWEMLRGMREGTDE